jgi:hypothetical protein
MIHDTCALWYSGRGVCTYLLFAWSVWKNQECNEQAIMCVCLCACIYVYVGICMHTYNMYIHAHEHTYHIRAQCVHVRSAVDYSLPACLRSLTKCMYMPYMCILNTHAHAHDVSQQRSVLGCWLRAGRWVPAQQGWRRQGPRPLGNSCFLWVACSCLFLQHEAMCRIVSGTSLSGE